LKGWGGIWESESAETGSRTRAWWAKKGRHDRFTTKLLVVKKGGITGGGSKRKGRERAAENSFGRKKTLGAKKIGTLNRNCGGTLWVRGGAEHRKKGKTNGR